jgi:hypothetical protein
VKRGALLAVFAAALTGLGCFASHFRTNPRVATVGGDPIVQMEPVGKFPSATRPPMVTYAKHSDPPGGKERVIGLAGPSPRAYPIGLLDRFEVVNDAMGDASYVVARCALTHITAIYDRRVDGRELTFENSGALWRDTLVLRDMETGTLWSAGTGVALFGPLAGRELKPVPAIYTSARAWARAFPDSTYMDLGQSTAVPFKLRLYGASPWQGVSGVKTEDRRHSPKNELFSVGQGSEVFAFTEEQVRNDREVRGMVNGRLLTVSWDDRLEAPRARFDEQEWPVIPMYWFALDRHFESIRTPGEVGSASAAP